MTLPKNAQLWLGPYLRGRTRRIANPRPAKRLWVAFCDHFEPRGGEVPIETARARMAAWQGRWPAIAEAAPRDSDGRPPCFTCFYPQEEYHPEMLDILAGLARTGTLDVEVHLHHFNDTADSLATKLREFTRILRDRHGLLHTHQGQEVFGFIHGNWALDNSHPTGWGCGVQGELQVLRDAGCYADFTMPSLPSPTQSRIVNQIYWTTGDPTQPRGFDHGVEATVGGGRQGDLLMIPGPLGIRYRDRLLPRVETGEVAVYDAPTEYRAHRWIDVAPRLGDDIFVKLYGHSAREDNAGALLGTGDRPGTLAALFGFVQAAAAERNLELHWASAFRMFERVDELIAGNTRGV